MPKRILVIDDEESVRDAFVLALRSTKYQIETAASGEEGIRMVRENPPDMVYLDLKMPTMNGVDTLSELREFYEKPIYIITAFYEDFLNPLNKVTEKGLEFELCRKPLDAQQIRDLSEHILDGDVENEP